MKTSLSLIVVTIALLLRGSAHAAPMSSPDASLENWAARRIGDRPGLPPLETRSVQRSALKADPGADLPSLMSAHVAGLSAWTMATTVSVPQDQRPEDSVYATTFTAADGSTQEFAAHFRPDDARPLYLRGSGYAAVVGAGFEQARAALLERVLGGSTEGLRVTALASPCSEADHSLRAGRQPVPLPWPRCWVFLVDDHPLREWQHDCRYVFLAEDLSAFAVQYGRLPLEAFAPNGDRVLFSLVAPHPVIDNPLTTSRLKDAASGADASPKSPGLDYSGSAQNCYAVIISGGCNAYNNWARYWNNCSQIYSTLRQKYGLPRSHITVLMSDGTDPGADRNIGTDYDPEYVNTDPDIDQDGVDDINFSCTHANVVNVLDNLRTTLTANDQLFIYVTDHGYQESGHDAGINLWNWEELRDDELEDLTDGMACHVLIAMGTCYAGGFIDDFAASVNNRALAVSCDWYESTWVGDTWPNYTQWLYHFTSGLRGFYPAAGPTPYHDGATCDADADNDERVTLQEAWTYATAHKPADNEPRYEDNAAGFGDTVYMNHLHIQLVNNLPVSYSQITKDFSFQVVAGEWAAVGVASANDHDIKADDNRQLTSVYRSSTYGGTTRDFVVVNGHRVGADTHYAQVYFGTDSSYNVEAEWQPYDMGLGSGLDYTASANETFDLFEANLTAGTSYDITVDVTSGNPDLGIYVFRPTVDNGSRSTANWSRNAGGAGVDETLTFGAPNSGYYGIVVVNESGGSGNYTITVAESPPLAAPTGVAASDGTYTDRIRVTWNSVSGATHYRVYRNTVNSSASASALNDWTAGTSYEDLTATVGRTYYYWVKAASTVDGDRESGFSASNGGYVLPPALASDAKVTATSDPTYYRAGGETGCNWWWAVGVRYDVAGENWSLLLYDDAGFDTLLETSAWNMPVDFVVVDGNHVGAAIRGVEVYRFSGSGSASVEFEGSGETLAPGAALFNWTAGDVVEMWDVALASGTTYRFTLDITAGTNDLGFALFGSGDGDYHRAREHYLARSDSGGRGADETFTFTTTAADDYGLCVWANSTNSASYTIRIETLAAGLWEGDISSDWHTPGNWNDGFVPDAADDVTIPTGAPRFPVISSANAACRSLTVGSGASLTLSNRVLTISEDFIDHGQLVLRSSAACELHVGGSVFWEEGSTCDVTGDSEMFITGSWNFEEGANVQLASGYVEFEGAGESWIRVYDGDCRFYRVRCDKTDGGMVGLSALCTAPIQVNNLYQYAASTLESYTGQPLVVSGFFNNIGGHFRFTDGALVYEGSPLVGLKPNTGDFLDTLVVSGPGALVLDATYSSNLSVRGSVVIDSGGLIATNMDLEVRGNWSNFVGVAGFTPGTRTVTFNGAGTSQTMHGTNRFYDLVDDRGGGGQLVLRGDTTVQHDFTVNYQTVTRAPLEVQGTLVISNAACQLIVRDPANVQAAKVNLGGQLLVYDGSLAAADLLNNGLHGYIVIDGGQVSLTQGTAVGEYFDLYGTLKITGGQLDLIGGRGDHYWPVSGACTFEMNGGVLDFHSQGWQIRNGFSGFVSNGTLRCAENVISQTAAFAPVGGLLELYGPLTGLLRQVPGSTFPSLLVNKTGSGRADVGSNLTFTGSVEIRGGVLKAYSNTVSVAGSWSNSVGTAGFSEDTGTVRFVGGSRAAVQTDETFYRLELDKTYAGFDGLEVNGDVHVLNDLAIMNGVVELNSGSMLDVDRDVMMASGAGLNANDPAPIEIHVGRHWVNLNTGFSTTYGFDPGYESLVVFDGGAAVGELATSATTETFDTVRIDRPGGMLRVLDAVTLRDDLTVLNGSFSYLGGPFTHRLRGDLVIETGGAWNDNVSTVVFDGTAAQVLNHKSMSGWFKHMVVEKNTGLNILPLTLQSDVLLLGGGTLTVRRGYMDLNGHYVRCTGDVTVEKSGKLLVGARAWVEVGDPGTLEVQAGGLLDVRGTASRPAAIKNWNGPYAFVVQSNATIRAENAVFEGMNADGLWINNGAVVEEPFTFHGCTFRNGASGGALLRLDNNQVLTIRNAVFPSNAGGGASNVRKSVRAGHAYFVNATGAFAGEAYDADLFNLIDWHKGTLSQLHLTGPTAATMNGTYGFTATVTGDMPLTPLTYLWTVTDQSSRTHTLNVPTDTWPDCRWTTPGTKTVRVTVTNAIDRVSASLSVDVRPLSMQVLGRQWINGTNAVVAEILGTSADSSYQVQYRTNLTAGGWSNALSGGLTVPGSNSFTLWLDLGGPGRDVTTATQMFYRVVLPSP